MKRKVEFRCKGFNKPGILVRILSPQTVIQVRNTNLDMEAG